MFLSPKEKIKQNPYRYFDRQCSQKYLEISFYWSLCSVKSQGPVYYSILNHLGVLLTEMCY